MPAEFTESSSALAYELYLTPVANTTPAQLTMPTEDVFQAWNDDVAARKRPELDEAPLLEAAASAVAVSSASQRFKSGFSTPLTTVEAQKGSGYATPRQSNVEIRQPQLVFPVSHYDGWKPPMPPTLEDELVEELLSEDCDTEYQMVSVSNFRMYRPPAPGRKLANYEGEMEPLHVVLAKRSCDSLLFDATISTSRGEKYVQGVPFHTLAIDAYNPDLPTSAGRISIQSTAASETRLWYLLDGSPSPEYERYHRAFLWVADLTKHAVDFMSGLERVTLSHFQRDFYNWIVERHGQQDSGPFHAWLSQYPSKDFRKAVAEHEEFIFKECFSVNDTLCKEPLWKELNHFQDQKDIAPPEKEFRTVVTEYVYQNFSHMPFQHFLKPKSTAAALMPHATGRRKSMRFLDAEEAQETAELHVPGKTRDIKIRKGDCIAMPPDKGSRWKDKASVWYAYVQDVDRDKGHLDLLWLYAPSMTPLFTGKYLYSNELFLSDHSDTIEARDDLYKITVKFMLARPGSCRRPKDFNFFVRQKYDTKRCCFLTLQEDDFRCIPHRQQSPVEEIRQKYTLGDVILVHPARPKKHNGEEKSEDSAKQQSNVDLLEPVVLEKFIDEQTISVRKLLRRKRDLHDVKARRNELVWTDQIFEISGSAVPASQTRCHVRWYKEEQIHAGKIPPPYNRDGCANCWYFCSQIVDLNGHPFWEQLSAPPTGLNQGWDPHGKQTKKSLKGLDLFCGGGNFGRGLAEGGAVEMTHAIDWDRHAVASYRANETQGNEASVYWGSVNDYLLKAMEGHEDQSVASINNIDFIAAGSPCQGFSMLNSSRSSDDSLRKISMIASMAAYIDFYRPKYALLENVVAMAHPSKGEPNFFSQMLCCLVGMGYQVTLSIGDAWSHGSPQKRSRAFILISAPGLVPHQLPMLTHSHPPSTPPKCLGHLPNDVRFAERIFEATPFKFVSAAEAMDELPWIGDGRLQTCITHPNHRTVQVERTLIRQLISHIPVDPPGSSIMKAILADEKNKTDRVPETLKEWYMSNCSKFRGKKNSKSYSRVDGNGLTSTITTSTNQSCAKAGQVLHWRQHRVLTILEARRAQGFPDHEVIVGRPGDQWKIVGNSVARTMALALGATLREAWLSSSEQHEDPGTCTPVSLVESCTSPISTAEYATPQQRASPRPRSTTPICRQTVGSTLSITQNPTSRETQDTLELSQKTTTVTVMIVPSSSSTEPAVKLEESEKMAEIMDLSSESETEEPSAGETQSTTTNRSGTSESRETLIIDLSEDTTDSECSAARKRKSRSSSSELSHDATAKRPKKEEPTIIDLADLTDESSDDLE